MGDSRHRTLLSVWLQLSDAAYTDRLASFLTSLGQSVVVGAPGRIEVIAPAEPELATSHRLELDIYLRVWRVLYPEAPVEIDENG